jgi:hypothetical protein
MITDLQRRVLAALPTYRTPEAQAAAVAEETAANGRSVTSVTLAEVVARVQPEIGGPQPAPGEVEATVRAILQELIQGGCVTGTVEQPVMTEQGFASLHELPAVVPPAHDLNRIRSMIAATEKLIEQGVEVASTEFHRAGGLTLEGFRTWRAACAAAEDPAELDALEQKVPATPTPTEAPNA